MKILYAYLVSAGDGAGVHVTSFVSAARERGAEVFEYSADFKQLTGCRTNWGIVKKTLAKMHWLSGALRHSVSILRCARAQRPDVIIFRFDPMHRFLLAIAALSKKIPVLLEVNAVRSLENNAARPRLSDLMDRWSLRRARHVVVVSERIKDHLLNSYGLASENVTVVPNGVDPELFHPSICGSAVRKAHNLENRFVYTFVGSFRAWHGVGDLIQVAQEFSKSCPESVLMLVGDGPEKPQYQRVVEEAGLQKNVLFVGRVGHEVVSSYLAASDVLMAPVRMAGFSGEFHGSPLKVFEYMAMGKPVVATAVGQISTVIEHGVSGWLVPATEPVGHMCEALRCLESDRALCAQLGEEARRRIESEFTWSANAEKILACCRSVIQ